MINNSINFKARYVSSDNIKRFDWMKKTYNPAKVNIIELDSANISDIKAIHKLVKNWKGAEYIHSIAGIICSMHARYIDKNEHSVYAVTTQKKNFAKLNSKKILGLAEVKTTRDDSVNLDYLQVNPDYIYSVKNRKYNGVGKCILDFIKNTYMKTITLRSDYTATDFYEKNGFEIADPKKMSYVWNPKKEI